LLNFRGGFQYGLKDAHGTGEMASTKGVVDILPKFGSNKKQQGGSNGGLK